MMERHDESSKENNDPDADEEKLWSVLDDSDRKNTFNHLLENNLENPRLYMLFKSVKDWNSEAALKLPCLITNLQPGSRNKKRGQQQPYARKGVIGKKGKKIGIHSLAAWVHTGRKPQPKEHASHWYCDTPKCANPAHVLWETWDLNITRFCCKRFKEVQNYRCPHVPTCVGCVSVSAPQQ